MEYNRVFSVGNDVELVDSSGTAFGTSTNRIDVETFSADQEGLLTSILKELKKTNMYLADMANLGILENKDIN